ncbi:hypothetical protein N8911_01060 [bacterium]|jgi:hypothetical protein|nr:hypothetical protein [bacterium]
MKRTREEFEKKIVEFFQRHDESKIELAHTMSHRFVNHQDEVFEHLSDLYHEKEGIEVSDDNILSDSILRGSGI